MASSEADEFGNDAAAADRKENEETLACWRTATTRFAKVVAQRVEDVAKDGDKNAAVNDKRIRQIASLILSAQRAMEMKDSYEQKVRSGQKSDPTSEEQRVLTRLERIARAAGITIPGARSREVPSGDQQ